MWLYTGLGCARSPKKVLLAGRPFVPGCKLEDVATSDHSEVCDIPLPHKEAELSAAPTREASFLQESLGRIRRTAGSLAVEAEVVPLNVPCHGCGKLIIGALYMGYDRAYCSAAACDKLIVHFSH